MRKILTTAVLFLSLSAAHGVEENDLSSAQASFKYLSTTLRVFNDTGRLVNNPGIDGSDLEEFVKLLRNFYEEFQSGFGPRSAMCDFYLDPENGRMTIEERAEIAFSLLRDLPARRDRYLALDEEFQEQLEVEFGSILLRNITDLKMDSISNQRLPASEFDEAAKINFADTACQ